MTETQQRIALATWAGWTAVGEYAPAAKPGYEDDPGPRVGPSRIMGCRCSRELAEVPDYTRDLNAIHEVELRLTVGDQWALYYSHFVDEGGVKINATAAQRAEALLRTLGLWKEEA